jgi:hypothetical protein
LERHPSKAADTEGKDLIVIVLYACWRDALRNSNTVTVTKTAPQAVSIRLLA